MVDVIDIICLLMLDIFGWMILLPILQQFSDNITIFQCTDKVWKYITDIKQILFTATYNNLILYYILLTLITITCGLPLVITMLVMGLIILLFGGYLSYIGAAISIIAAIIIGIGYGIYIIGNTIANVIIKLCAVPTPTIPTNVTQPPMQYTPMCAATANACDIETML